MKFKIHSTWMWVAVLFLGISTTSMAQSLPKVSAENLINNYLQEKRADLAKSGAVEYRVGDEIIEKGESIRRVYAQQIYQGIDIRDAILGIHMAANGKQVVSDQFTDFKPSTTSASISAEEALRIAMTKNGGFPLVANLQEVPNAAKNASQATIFERGEIAASDMKARLIYVNASKSATQDAYRLAWETQAFTRDRQHYWLTYVDATFGKILDNQDLVLHCSFGGAETDYSTHEQACADHAHHERALAAALAIEKEMEAIKNREVSIPSAPEHFFADASMMSYTYLVLDMPADAPNDLSSGTPDNPDNQFSGLTNASGTPEGNDPYDNFVDQTLVTTEGDPIASELGWLTTGDASGIDTEGNNVYSFYDVSPGPLGGAPTGAVPPSDALNNEWAYEWNLDEEPGFGSVGPVYGDTRNAAVVNLFYWNNLIHDVFYHYGFDEPGRNFQKAANPSGPSGGVHQDHVLAQAQDGGGTNNANMLTLADGTNGQMQMYLWTGSTQSEILVSDDIGAPGITGIPDGFQRQSEIMHPDENDLLEMVLIDSYSGTGATSESETDGCGYGSGIGAVADNSGDISGRVVFIDRGTCSFVEKAHGAQQSGAIALIVMNNDQANPDQAIAMGGSDATSNTLTIPAYMVSFNDGVRIKDALTAKGGVITGNLKQAIPSIGRDGDFDNGVIAHEYGHGISTRSSIRAAGGLGTLGGDEQGGEGWSDWWGLFMTLRSNDLLTSQTAVKGTHPAGDLPVKGIGNYVRYLEEDGPGIRPRPYTTDRSRNEYTYAGSENGGFGLNNGEITVPHGIGFIWCTMLYEMLQEFVYEYGMNDDIGGVRDSETTNLLRQINVDPGGDQTIIDNNLALAEQLGGNIVTNLLIIQGIKVQPSRGTFVDQRNAILQADELLFGGEHACLIWKAFASRGLGFSAQAGTNSRGDEADGFDLPPTCDAENLISIVTIEKTTAARHDNGTDLTYTIKVKNTSPVTATNVVVRDNLASGMTFKSASDNGAVNTGAVEWTNITLAENEEKELTVTYTIATTNESCVHFFDNMDDINTTINNWQVVGTNLSPGGILTEDDLSDITGADIPAFGWQLIGDAPYSGDQSWFVVDPDNSSQQYLQMTGSYAVTNKPTKLVFYHLVGTEANFDNGVLEVSIDGGSAYVKVPAEAFESNGYNSNVAVADNPAQNGPAYSGSSGGYIASQVDIKSIEIAPGVNIIEGDNVNFRFSFSSDVLTPATGWFVDDVVIADNPTFLENTATVTAGNSPVTNQSTTSVLIEGTQCEFVNESLAVQFIDFTAQAADESIVLNWETANEVNAHHFVVERRTKADFHFTQIGTVSANNEVSNNYQFVDTDVRGGVDYFYRLRQVDTDAKSAFSPIRQARIASNGGYEVDLVPNPTTGAVVLNWTKDLPSNYELEVISANGQVVMVQQVANGGAPLQLDLSNYPANLYFVKINTEVGTITKKLMLKK